MHVPAHFIDYYMYMCIDPYFLSHRFLTAHIWACPPSEGDDYIFHCHPIEQKVPKPKRLVDWYKKMLDKGKSDSVVFDYRVSPLGLVLPLCRTYCTCRGIIIVMVDTCTYM